MEKQKLRSEIEDQYKWDLTPIYANKEAWYEDYTKAESLIEEIKNYNNFISSPSKLYEFLQYDEKVERLMYRLYYYSHLNYDADTLNDEYQVMERKISDLMNHQSELSAFVMPTFFEVNFEKILQYIEEKPELKEYQFTLEQLYRNKEHVLSEKEEEMLSLLNNSLTNPSNTYEILTDSDLTFGTIRDEDGNEIELTESNYGKYTSSFHREVRKQAFEKMYTTLANFKNTITSTYLGDMDANINLAKIRKYPSALEASLHADNIDKNVYNNLISTIHDNLDVLYDYYELKRQMLKVDELHLYDLHVPLIQLEKQHYDFEEAKKMVLDAVKILGDDYVDIIKKEFDEKWIDIYNNKGKRTGAYSSGFYDTNPYILLNYEGRLDDVFTLIHESGHSAHTYLSCHNNSYTNSSYKIFVAEVASITNELLMAKYLLKNSNSKEEKLNILNRLLELFKGTIYRQTMFAEFEKNMYDYRENGNVITSEVLCNEYYKLNKLYFGEKVVVDDLIRYEWERVPHFYYNFYVYKYAIGLSAACYIVENIINGKENAVENYKSFLKSGGSMYPIDELKLAGVDVSKKEVVESAVRMFKETIEQFKSLI